MERADSQAHDYGKGLVFFINQQPWYLPPGKRLRQHQWKQRMMKKKAGPPRCPLVTVDSSTKPSVAAPAEARSD
uniref:Uncharacterized protein n=1 Tax=Fagus sylvatica TaxID=28930 RepID=A0A2N9I336_FAGSY